MDNINIKKVDNVKEYELVQMDVHVIVPKICLLYLIIIS